MLETSLEILTYAESSKFSSKRLIELIELIFKINPDERISPRSSTTVCQFVESLIKDRSRILHGTWSTLNSRVPTNRVTIEAFVVAILRFFTKQLAIYRSNEHEDNTRAFISWMKTTC